MLIPRLIHQIWTSPDIPERFVDLRNSWLRFHPSWTYQLWSDVDLRDLVRQREPELLPMFDGYVRSISRADVGRYVILKHLGGLYVDLDFECFRPLEPLLAGRHFVIGTEPDSHRHVEQALARMLPYILCPSLIASVPHHWFWTDVFAALAQSVRNPDVLDQTGPFLLTDCYINATRQDTIHLLPPSQVYPVDKFETRQGKLYNITYWEHRTRQAYALHYWDGSWYRAKGRRFPPLPSVIKALTRGPKKPKPAHLQDNTAVVTCIMTRRAAFGRIEGAIRSYQRQSHADRELIIVDLRGDDDLAGRLRVDPSIRVMRPADRLEAREAFDLAVAQAAGHYVCCWDEGDLYDPERLALQMGAVKARGTEACLLERSIAWHAASGQLTLCESGPGLKSLLCERAVLAERPASAAARSDDDVLQTLDLVCVYEPRLYISVVDRPMPGAWPPAGVHFEGERAAAIERELGRTIPLSSCAKVFGRTDVPSFHLDRSDRLDKARSMWAGGQGVAAPSTPSRPASLQAPRVLVLTPVRNAARHLPAYRRALDALHYPTDRLSIAFLEGDSDDDSKAVLSAWLPQLRSRLSRAELFFHDAGQRLDGPRWAPSIQFKRRSTLARLRNRLVQAALRDEDWVLWIDADIIDYPPDTLTRLLAAHRDIVVPNCVRTAGGPSFDLNTFKSARVSLYDEAEDLVDGILQPPKGKNRLYLDDLRGQDLVRVDGVGGAMLLVRADLHREGLVFPAYSYRGYIETEGLAVMARDIGVTSWGLPGLEVIHAPD